MRRAIQVEKPSSKAFDQLRAPVCEVSRSTQVLPAFRFHESAVRQLPERYEDIAVAVFDRLDEQVKPLLSHNRRIELFVSGDSGCWDESDGRRVSVRIVGVDKRPDSVSCEVVRLRDSDAYDRFGVELEKKIMRICGVGRYLE